MCVREDRFSLVFCVRFFFFFFFGETTRLWRVFARKEENPADDYKDNSVTTRKQRSYNSNTRATTSEKQDRTHGFSTQGVLDTMALWGISDTGISNIPGYVFEHIPACGGWGLFVDKILSYSVLEKASTQSFQALWIDISFDKSVESYTVNTILHRAYWNTWKRLSITLLRQKRTYVSRIF